MVYVAATYSHPPDFTCIDAEVAVPFLVNMEDFLYRASLEETLTFGLSLDEAGYGVTMYRGTYPSGEGCVVVAIGVDPVPITNLLRRMEPSGVLVLYTKEETSQLLVEEEIVQVIRGKESVNYPSFPPRVIRDLENFEPYDEGYFSLLERLVH